MEHSDLGDLPGSSAVVLCDGDSIDISTSAATMSDSCSDAVPVALAAAFGIHVRSVKAEDQSGRGLPRNFWRLSVWADVSRVT